MTAHSPKLILPFTLETAIQKVRIAEDNWNSGNPQQVALAYTIDSKWRNRAEFITGREEIVQFLTPANGTGRLNTGLSKGWHLSY